MLTVKFGDCRQLRLVREIDYAVTPAGVVGSVPYKVLFWNCFFFGIKASLLFPFFKGDSHKPIKSCKNQTRFNPRYKAEFVA